MTTKKLFLKTRVKTVSVALAALLGMQVLTVGGVLPMKQRLILLFMLMTMPKGRGDGFF